MSQYTPGRPSIHALSDCNAGHVPAFDGLRALGVLLLIVGHYASEWPPVWGLGAVEVPVDYAIVLLFTLTGFLVAAGLRREFDLTGDIDILRLYLRKFVRVFPAFFVFTAVTSAHHLVTGAEMPAGRPVAVLGFLGNYYYGLAREDTTRHIIGHLWSVAVGAHFLILWPLLHRVALRQRREGVLIAGLVVVVAAVVALRTSLHWFSDVAKVYIYTATETRLDALALGALGALLWRRLDTREAPVTLLDTRAAPFLMVGLLAASVSMPSLYRLGPGYTIEAALTALVLIQLCRHGARREYRWLDSRPLRWTSAIAFSLFLWHLYGLTIDRAFADLHLSMRAPLTLFGTIATAAVAYIIVERPAIAWSRRI